MNINHFSKMPQPIQDYVLDNLSLTTFEYQLTDRQIGLKEIDGVKQDHRVEIMSPADGGCVTISLLSPHDPEDRWRKLRPPMKLSINNGILQVSFIIETILEWEELKQLFMNRHHARKGTCKQIVKLTNDPEDEEYIFIGLDLQENHKK